ncbi:hypothetical protein LTS18_008235 [Coniosporium uncinatum]|uniref:Uncharacterized protein n=1 Tax=Coniosporium uncinatum TaxID=93489 RepID=A0ACC3DX26_9PEZI|nr:hypothetical protein LTS18_008235 [Coniosporium uncinatum]
MRLDLSKPLSELVRAKYAAAKSNGALTFSPTELSIIHTPSGIPFQLRYCPALAKKPKPDNSKPSPEKKPDPFEDPSEDLLVSGIPTKEPSHILVLNKYPVIAEHFIIATKSNKKQTHLLEQDDLEATYACLKTWEQEGGAQHGQDKRLFAFFNSGAHSGASQPHRHLQFLPVDSMNDEKSEGWELLMDQMISAGCAVSTEYPGFRSLAGLPFTHFAARLPHEPTAEQLYRTYNGLYKASADAVREYIRKATPGTLELHDTEGGASPISYNLSLTTSAMAMVPRRAEGDSLRRPDGTEVGDVAFNGTLLAGTLMVKTEEEWGLLKNDPSHLDSILKAIGIPTEAASTERL